MVTSTSLLAIVFQKRPTASVHVIKNTQHFNIYIGTNISDKDFGKSMPLYYKEIEYIVLYILHNTTHALF